MASSRASEALNRWRQLGTDVEQSPDPLDDDEPGWTPSTGDDESRHRARPAPAWRVSWRAGLLLTLVVALGAGGWVWRSASGAPVEPRATLTAPAGSGLPGPSPGAPTSAASAGGAEPGAAAGGPSSPGAGPATASGTATEIFVHVVGAVASPGVVQLKPGARVADAVDAAGGAGADADLSRLNLARTVSDGEQVVVPRPGDPDPVGVSTAPGNSAIAGAPAAPPSTGEAATGPAAAVVNLNTATQAELDGLPGIGPVLAARIVEWRTSNGPFTAVDELGEVGGIGDKLLAQLHDKVTV